MNALLQHSEASATGYVPSDPDDDQFNYLGDAIYARLSGKPAKGPARNWNGASLMDIGRSFLHASGQRAPRNPEMLVSLLMAGNVGRSWFSSSGQHWIEDFCGLLGSASEAFMAETYLAHKCPLMAIARERNAPKNGTRPETPATFTLKTHTRIFTLTRRAVINDDLNAFAQVLADFGAAAAETEARLLVDLIESNPVLADDSTALFHASHKNIMTGSLTASSLDAAHRLLNLSPHYLVVPEALKDRAENVLADMRAAAGNDASNWARTVELIAESRLANPDHWYLFADPHAAHVFECAWLNGIRQPTLMAQDGWNVEGTKFKARLDFGAGATGFRGAIRSTG